MTLGMADTKIGQSKSHQQLHRCKTNIRHTNLVLDTGSLVIPHPCPQCVFFHEVIAQADT